MNAGLTRGAVLLVAGMALLPGCSADDDPPRSGPGTAAAEVCDEEPGQLPVVQWTELEPVGEGGPHLDRALRVTRTPSGGRCVDLAVDHADPDPDVVGWEVRATQGERTWRLTGAGADDEPRALRIDVPGCVEVSGSLVVLGAGEAEFEYVAEGQVGRGCPAA